MRLYVALAQTEIAWICSVDRLKNGDFIILDAFLVAQEASFLHVTLDGDAINLLTIELAKQGDAGLRSIELLRGWGHSHVEMGETASAIDQDMFRFFTSGEYPWCLRMIGNKFGRLETTVYLRDAGVVIEDAEWRPIEEIGLQLRDEIAAEIAEKLKVVDPESVASKQDCPTSSEPAVNLPNDELNLGKEDRDARPTA